MKLRDHRGIMPLPDMVAGVSAEYEKRPCLVARERSGDRVITYGELGARVKALARGLVKMGLKPGDRCVILGPNSPLWALSYLAVSTAGGVCVPIDSLLSENEIRLLVADAKAKMAFVAPRFLDCMIDTGKGFPVPSRIFAMADDPEGLPTGIMSMGWLEQQGDPKARLPHPGLEDLAVVIYTSGTTGAPKGVMLTHKNIVSDIAACYQAVDYDQERFLSVLPLHHTFECTAGFLLPLYSGCTITYARSLKSRVILEDLKASRATAMLGVPLLYQKMIEGLYRAVSKAPAPKRMAFRAMMGLVKAAEKAGNPHLGKRLFRSLRQQAGLGYMKYLVVGGAPLMSWIPREFRRLGITMIQGYGLTESSPVLTINPPNAPKDDSIGRPLAGVEVRIHRPDDSGVGELCFRGPMIMKGYYKNRKATEKVIDKDGWLHTGDLGFVDEQGYVHICGRAKDLIVTPAGKNVYPEEIEVQLNASPFILESMVYGRPTESGGESVHVLIVPDYEAIGEHAGRKDLSDDYVRDLISKEVKQVNRLLSSYKKIKSFKIRQEELPKTSTRKIKRHLVKVD